MECKTHISLATQPMEITSQNSLDKFEKIAHNAQCSNHEVLNSELALAYEQLQEENEQLRREIGQMKKLKERAHKLKSQRKSYKTERDKLRIENKQLKQ